LGRYCRDPSNGVLAAKLMSKINRLVSTIPLIFQNPFLFVIPVYGTDRGFNICLKVPVS
jgi:hypothetical protein